MLFIIESLLQTENLDAFYRSSGRRFELVIFRRMEFRDGRALKRLAIDFLDKTIETAMNHSIDTADRLTHLKIVATALAIAIGVVWIGIAARATYSAGVLMM